MYIVIVIVIVFISCHQSTDQILRHLVVGTNSTNSAAIGTRLFELVRVYYTWYTTVKSELMYSSQAYWICLDLGLYLAIYFVEIILR